MASEAASRAQVVDELFFEQEHPVISGAYRHGWLRTPLTVARALFSRAGRATPGADAFGPGRSVAVVFFENEHQAVLKVQERLGIDEIVRLDMRTLPLIRRTLGLPRLARETAGFVRDAIRRRGASAWPRLGVPLLGWLLFRTLQTLMARHAGMRIVTANLQHPLSVAAAHAAKATGQRTVYVEHASTTSAVFADRGCELFVVDLPHTAALLEKLGVAPGRIQRIGGEAPPRAAPIVPPVRSVGLCINDLDSTESIWRMVDTLKQAGLDVTLRVHDSDRRMGGFRKMAAERGIHFDSARESRIQAFFLKVDVVIAGNSNVLGDALRAGKAALYYWDGDPAVFDYYGLATHYGIPCAGDPASLVRLLRPAPAARERGMNRCA